MNESEPLKNILLSTNLSSYNYFLVIDHSYIDPTYIYLEMKIEQSTLQKTFTVKHKGNSYHIDYLNSDGQILGLLNRNHWEITDQDGEELGVYEFQSSTKQEKEQIKQNRRLVERLIRFCIKHFNDYNPDL